ncbi:MAG: ATP-binding protein [Oscillospiraceae bacterium]|jgi:MinD superfamily P-loop ATPase|nr:ATP-binding protein [Oscillospiraceae bacterium]
MQIAVLSGKGGTGKTFVSVNLAAVCENAVYIDCDVEEPNGFLFLKPKIEKTKTVEVTIPEIDESRCSGCRDCVRFCRFNALAFLKGKPRLFPELCHSCGGCSLICPTKAIREIPRGIGVIEQGASGKLSVLSGTLNSGEATGVPIIRRLIQKIPSGRTAVIDCPPGSSCTVMESIQDADFCLLVAEPTLFGLENLKLAAQLVKSFKKPCGIVINKDTADTELIDRLAEQENIPILLRIPFDRGLARTTARGELAVNSKTYGAIFRDLMKRIRETAGGKS